MGFKPLRSIPEARLLSAKGNDMKLQSFQMQIGPEEARAKALKQAGPLGKLMLSKDRDIHMRTVFIENKIITYQITNEPSLLSRLLRKNRRQSTKAKFGSLPTARPAAFPITTASAWTLWKRMCQRSRSSARTTQMRS